MIGNAFANFLNARQEANKTIWANFRWITIWFRYINDEGIFPWVQKGSRAKTHLETQRQGSIQISTAGHQYDIIYDISTREFGHIKKLYNSRNFSSGIHIIKGSIGWIREIGNFLTISKFPYSTIKPL